MIYFVGDTHGTMEYVEKLIKNETIEKATENDYVIVCGDFGLPFLTSQAEGYEKFLELKPDGVESIYDIDEDPESGYLDPELFGIICSRHTVDYTNAVERLNKKKYTLLFIDGNHDNHDFWGKQPVEDWHGGKVHKHPHIENCYHLMRGEVYDIDDKKIFTFGGALSIDKNFRSMGFDWWVQEEATKAEMDYALENLEKHGNSVDIVVTHTIPQSLIRELDNIKSVQNDNTARFLDIVYASIEFKHWVAGHFHMDTRIEKANIDVLYESIKRI